MAGKFKMPSTAETWVQQATGQANSVEPPIGNEKPKQIPTSLRLDADLKIALDEYLNTKARRGESQNSVINQALREWLSKYGQI